MLNIREREHLRRIVREAWPKPQAEPKHSTGKRRPYGKGSRIPSWIDSPLSMRVRVVVHVVALDRNVTIADIMGTKRTQGISAARHIANYIARRLLGASFPELGASFNRDYSTIIHGCNVVEKRMKEYPEYARSIERLVTQAEGQ